MKKTFDEIELRSRLTGEQYHVTQEKGTEAPFSGEYDHEFEDGTYQCVVCGHELFTSENKYDSGCGWPAFDKSLDKTVHESSDLTLGMSRTEVTCENCGAHLGHLFPDGPPDTTGMRYCINSASLKFAKKEQI